jgi:predicted secreted hydrolase
MPLRIVWIAFLLVSSFARAGEWRLALPGWEYEFPRDHGNHPGFKTEWWYFTGNLQGKNGKEYGYQLTFFRQGIRPDKPEATSRFVVQNIQFAHFALTEVTDGKFHFYQQITRGAFGEAGFGDSGRVAWIGDWSCEWVGEHAFRLRASGEDAAIDLLVESTKPPIFHGANGVSQKSEGEGRASHYYSLTRLKTSGTIRAGQESISVEGLSWFDHEWATNQLDAHQTGWDWFSLQFVDGSELMLFQIRTKDGGRDPFSGGTFIAADGSTIPVKNPDFALNPTGFWKSPTTRARYPTRWEIEIPEMALSLEVKAAVQNQELVLAPISYWEGSIRASGTRKGQPVRASGYLEMTGYGSPIVGMQAAGPAKPAVPANEIK